MAACGKGAYRQGGLAAGRPGGREEGMAERSEAILPC